MRPHCKKRKQKQTGLFQLCLALTKDRTGFTGFTANCPGSRTSACTVQKATANTQRWGWLQRRTLLFQVGASVMGGIRFSFRLSGGRRTWPRLWGWTGFWGRFNIDTAALPTWNNLKVMKSQTVFNQPGFVLFRCFFHWLQQSIHLNICWNEMLLYKQLTCTKQNNSDKSFNV